MPPNPPDEPLELPLIPLEPLDDDDELDELEDRPELEPLEPAVPREPADTEPALRLAEDEDDAGATALTLLPAEAVLTSPAMDADLDVAALT